MAKRSERLGKEKILPLLFKLALPSMIGMLVGSLYNIIDSIYIGHISTEALSALSLAFPIQLFLISVAAGIGISTSSLISRLLGEKKEHLIKETTETVTLLVVIYTIIVSLIGVFFGHDLISLFTNNPSLIKMGGDYISIIMMGSIAIVVPMVFNNFLRGYGDTVIPMYTMIIGTVLNILIDPLLIFGISFFPELGVKGAAYATVISRLASAVFVIIILLKRSYYIKLKLFIPKKFILKEIANIAIPAMAMLLMVSIMFIGANKIVATYSVVGIAVLGIFARLQSFIMMPIFGISQGFQPILGYNFGSKNKKRVKKTMWSGIIVVLTFSMLGFLIFFFFPKILISMFSKDPELIRVGSIALKRISLSFPFMGLSIIISTAFQAIGKGFPSFIISFFRQILLLLPLMYFLSKTFGLNASWYAFPLAESIALVVSATWITSTFAKEYSKKDDPESSK